LEPRRERGGRRTAALAKALAITRLTKGCLDLINAPTKRPRVPTVQFTRNHAFLPGSSRARRVGRVV
jgi:hypothetical protein